MDTRVLIIADDRLARAGLAALLVGQPGMSVAGQIASEDAQPAALKLYQPDVVLWDVGWNPTPVLERLADLHASGAQVVALVQDDAPAVQLWASGTRGLLLRDSDTRTLLAALSAVAQGLAVLAPSLAVVLRTEDSGDLLAPAGQLTAREQEVLRLLAEGLANKAIAQRLAISEHTVKFHINALMGKLGAQSRTEAVVRAMRLGLVSV
jgi:DNA-binding NarL/FixJ family response regulator